MPDYLRYYELCYKILKNIYPNKYFELILISRIYWQNLVFYLRDIKTNERYSIKLFLRTYGSNERYRREIYFSERFLQEFKSFQSINYIYYDEINSNEITGILVQPWIIGLSLMKKVKANSLETDELNYLKKMFCELWSYETEYKSLNKYCSIYEVNTEFPSSLKYKLGRSEENAFQCIYIRLPSYKEKILRIQQYYLNFKNGNTRKCLVNGDPSAHEIIRSSDRIFWIDWEYVLYGFPMMDIAYIFYSLAHNFYDNELELSKFRERFFITFDINDISMFTFYFIEKIVMVENASFSKNNIEVLIWSIDYANQLVDEIC